MDIDIWDIILILLAILSSIWAFISKQYRIWAIIIAFILMTIIILSKQNKNIDSLIFEQNRLLEKLKIHEQLIDMKAEIKELQKKVK